jgi:hypothetical protein
MKELPRNVNPLETMHCNLLTEFHKVRKSRDKNKDTLPDPWMAIDGLIFNQIVASAKRATYNETQETAHDQENKGS